MSITQLSNVEYHLFHVIGVGSHLELANLKTQFVV